MDRKVEFKVGMTCGGCSNAVKRVLTKIEGVHDVLTNLDDKKVIVTCTDQTSTDELLGALMKWSSASGKPVELVL